jgi:hypothetical protein
VPNTLAYYCAGRITAVKRFMVQALGVNFYINFLTEIKFVTLERLLYDWVHIYKYKLLYWDLYY